MPEKSEKNERPVIPINVILASKSPRRRELLEQAGVRFAVFTGRTEVDESLDADLLANPEEAVKKLAERKAGAVVQEVLAQNPVGLGFVIGADTMVVLDGKIFGKPYSADLLANPEEAVKKLAERKAGAVVQEVLAQNPVGLGFVIGADTMVVLDGKIFGKPYSADHAREMLRALSGRTHQVITGVSVWMLMLNESEENGGDGNVSIGFRTFTETSYVTFKELSEEDINAYVATGETIDKAGAYGIQGKGAALVDHYEGDYNNIVGLPVDKLLENFPDLLRREVEIEIVEKSE